MGNLKDRNLYRESPAIVNARYSLSKQESDIVMLLLTNISKDDADFKDYVFQKSDLERRIGAQIKPSEIKAHAKSLMSKVLEVPNEKGFELFTWFSYFKYEDGEITCSFDSRLKPYLLELGHFILADSRHLLQIKTAYSRRIYMLLKERAKFGVRTFNVEELMDTLQVPKSYRIYSKFKQGILTKAVQEINKHTDLKVSMSEKKKGRKVVEVTFEIRKNDNDLKTFIASIRKLYVGEVLFFNRAGNAVKVSEEGLLYDSETMKTYTKEEAKKTWEWMHENQNSLECLRAQLPHL